MKDRQRFSERLKSYLFYGSIRKAEYDQVHMPVAKANHKALTYWSVLVSLFWIYCLVMSLKAPDYTMCRPAYLAALGVCIFSFLCSRFVVSRLPDTLAVFKFIFRLSLLGGGIGIAVCQWNVRSLTLFAVAIIPPSIFVDSTLSSLIVHCSALVIYILAGRNVIAPDIYTWGLGNYILFSVFGLLIGNAINKERFERYVFAESEKKLSEIQRRYAYYDRMTGLKNRRAYEEKLLELEKDPPSEYCIIMADINGLKAANDSIGHHAGDELITGASECLAAAFEGVDTIYRIGGDEYCVIMTGPEEKARQCLERLGELILHWKGRYNDHLYLSTGIASSREHSGTEAITAEADRMMYENKKSFYMSTGRGRRKNVRPRKKE
ncbi:MAG: GGDEF domain-containing protein [Clostridiales bacterium]|nr:GGDEF domain-containing protein [Clostridiales bacterium]